MEGILHYRKINNINIYRTRFYLTRILSEDSGKVLLKNNIELKRFMYLRNKNAINFGHIEIDDRELVTIDFTESIKIDENKFKSLIRSFA